LTYRLLPFSGPFRPEEMARVGFEASLPIQQFPAYVCPEAAEGTLLEVSGEGVAATYVKAADDGDGIVVRLQHIRGASVGEAAPYALRVPGAAIARAFRVNVLEENVEALEATGGEIRGVLEAGGLSAVRISFAAST
uniref:glycosyl hydrolase-related protein n=1 Tax=Cohnella sp. TaxID=1883426 RepID=UPI003561B566